MERFLSVRRAGMPLACAAFVIALAAPPTSSTSQADPKLPVEYSKTVKPLLAKFCAPCHTGKDASAGFDIGQINGVPWV
ncbi:MAG: hypothetical protein JSS65_15090, partial [Armatimonadetes bacterium]|nr:hypothetical protein [Armatimonadota bacterium]